MLCSNQLSYVAKWRALFAQNGNASSIFIKNFSTLSIVYRKWSCWLAVGGVCTGMGMGNVRMIAVGLLGRMFGFTGMAALLGHLADAHDIKWVYTLGSVFALFGRLALFLARMQEA